MSVWAATGVHAAKQDAATWLLEPVGARAIALQAYTAVADDASTVALNPAGLAKLSKVEALFYTRENSYDMSESYLAAVWPQVGPGTLGVAWRNAGVGDSEDAPFIYTDGTGKDFGRGSYSANALTVAYGVKLMPELKLGAGIEYALDNFGGLDGTAFEGDKGADASGFGGLVVGVSGKVPDLLQYGLSVRNVGGKLGDDSEIPVTLSAGVSTTFPGKRAVLLSVELQKQFVDIAERTVEVKGGVEYRLAPISLRLGTSLSGDRSRWFAGFGVNVASVRADYAFQFINRTAYSLGDVPRHFVSLSYVY
jgi:hypothetical protein